MRLWGTSCAVSPAGLRGVEGFGIGLPETVYPEIKLRDFDVLRHYFHQQTVFLRGMLHLQAEDLHS